MTDVAGKTNLKREQSDEARATRSPAVGQERPRADFLYGVHDDVLTDPSDLQAMYDNIPSTEKKLQWIENTTARWDGYMEFQRRPQPMLDWFARYL